MNDREYAGFWIRFLAALIDTVLFIVVFSIPLTVIYGIEYWTTTTTSRGYLDTFIQYILPIILTVWFWTKYLGTPGKMILRLRIIDAATGGAISTPKAIGRYLGYYLSMLPFFLGFIWVGIDKKKQGFHDKLAGTVVIRERKDETSPAA